MRASARHRPRATPKESFLGRLLDPTDRLSESIFSILILLTFTLAFRIFKLGADPSQQIPNTYLRLYDNAALAIRVSNVVSFVVLFGLGYQWGKHTGANPWRTGLMLAAIAAVMVLIAIPLGG